MEEELERDMTPRLIIDLGMRFATEESRQKRRFGLYECQYCMNEFEANSYNIKHSKVAPSCYCQQYRPREGSVKHGLRSNRFYNTWKHMLHRCNSLNNKYYKDYGGRGITVCEEWLDVRNFVAWCDLTHPNIEGLSLDRIDVDGNYEPSNCRWADRVTQNTNQRKRSTNTSGYVGVCWHKRRSKWFAQISVNCKNIGIGSFKTLEEAVQARDNYIIENKLPHKLSTDYQ